MNWFSASNESEGVVAADRSTVWELLTDPDALAEMTPLLQRIDTHGDVWRWQFSAVPILGTALAPAFTERMTFAPEDRIDYHHEPADGHSERTGVDGWYTLSDAAEGTHLAIGLTVKAHLPLSRLAAPAVRTAMRTVIAATGAGFARNLERRLARG
jgi:carbon monoxide dehydrogenase subunit G